MVLALRRWLTMPSRTTVCAPSSADAAASRSPSYQTKYRFSVHERRPRRCCRRSLGHHRKRSVFDGDGFRCVARLGGGFSDHHRDRIADKADTAAYRQATIVSVAANYPAMVKLAVVWIWLRAPEAASQS